MSGEMNTSLGNTFTNFIACYFIHMSKGGTDEGFDAVFEGDDALVCTDIEFTPQDFENLGFKVKLESVDPQMASFCGQIFTDQGVTIRDPIKFFQGFGWTHSCIHAGNDVLLSLLRGKCLSALYETPDCPIISEAAWYCLARSGNVARFSPDGYHNYDAHAKYTPRPPKITAQTRALFSEKFGISPGAQLHAEKLIRTGHLSDIYQDIVTDFTSIADIVNYTHTYCYAS